MYCGDCGAKAKAGDKFCRSCGAALPARNSGASAEDAASENVAEAAHENAAPQRAGTPKAFCSECLAAWRPDETGACSKCGWRDPAQKQAPPEAAAAGLAPPTSPTRQPASRLGGWAVPVALFGFIGGLIGYLGLKPVDSQRARHVLQWGVIWSCAWLVLGVVTILAVAGLAREKSSGSPAASPPAANSATTTAPTTTAPTVTLHPVPPRSVVQTVSAVTADSGYAAKANVIIYPLERATNAVPLPISRRSTPSACAHVTANDAVIPISFHVTNTHGSLEQVALTWTANERSFTNEIQGDNGNCYGQSDEYIFGNISTLQSGESFANDAFVVIHNYYTPEFPYPRGNQALLANLSLQPSFCFGPSKGSNCVIKQQAEPNDVPVIPR